ncbi:uncharacterized protein LOC133745026 [Rosa rugosa]|uniref:uncharacterized protein LOC133745026 n=1 Tax=Rosa rugosa TaxID=74645 RepID=UPI002B4057BA|nr:uncharacterized protein LOC133745026 [Rosa rugosa]
MKPQILSILKGAKPNQNHVNLARTQTPTLLLGPPEIGTVTTTTAPPQVNSGDPFMDLMVSNYNNTTSTSPRPPMGLTENSSPTFLTSGNPCLDFFFHVVPDTKPEYFNQQLPLAWSNDAVTTLKLICNLRGVRGTGKCDKEGFYTAAYWLYNHHPKTLAYNVASVAAFGYFKDLPEILYRLLEGQDIRKTQKEEWERIKRYFYKGPGKVDGLRSLKLGHLMGPPADHPPRDVKLLRLWEKLIAVKSNKKKLEKGEYKTVQAEWAADRDELKSDEARELMHQKIIDKTKNAVARYEQDSDLKFLYEQIWDVFGDCLKSMEADTEAERNEMFRLKKENVRELRYERIYDMARKVVSRYQQDSNFQVLHEQISDVFAECLRSDMECLKKHQRNKISLAAKWCPSLDSSFDKATLLCESIARKVFPRELYPEYQGLEEAHYAYRVRDRLRKEVYVPLRRALELPELYMTDREWNSLPYNRVASVAMKLYKHRFIEKDCERFEKYLAEVKEGKAKIAAGALLPHEIIASLNDGDGGQVAELQWKRMVEDLVELGKLRNCLAVCDVSGSMEGTPMEVCVALGLLVSELSEEPWKGKVITFSQNPQLHLIQGEDLSSKCEFVTRMDWGMNTDFQKVFDLILQVAVKGKLKPEQMIKRVFVFSDMEFDEASGHRGYGYGYYGREDNEPQSWETDYEVIQRKFREKGYGDAVPQIVFWNLRDSRSTPVTETQNGVALVSGFSKNLLKLFLDNDGQIRPDLIMEKAISGKEYQHLVVVD